MPPDFMPRRAVAGPISPSEDPSMPAIDNFRGACAPKPSTAAPACGQRPGAAPMTGTVLAQPPSSVAPAEASMLKQALVCGIEGQVPPNAGTGIDFPRVARSAFLATVGTGVAFGGGFAAANAAAAAGGPLVKAIAAFMPAAAAAASVPADARMRDLTGITPTESASPSLWDDLVAPGTLLAAHLLCSALGVRRSPANSLAGVAKTFTVSAVGTGVAGGLTEVFNQISHTQAANASPKSLCDEMAPQPEPEPASELAHRQTCGRAFSQLPLAAYKLTKMHGNTPKGSPLTSVVYATAGYSARTLLMPPERSSHTPKPPGSEGLWA
jgi:hypothetical protein